MISPQAAIAISLALLGLAGCDEKSISDIGKALDKLNGRMDALTALAEASSVEMIQPPSAGTDASSSQPISSSSEPVTIAVEPSSSSHELQFGDPGYVCVPVFRQKSCDDQGKPHDLDSNMNWID